MLFAFAFGVNKDVIKVYYHKIVELLCHNLYNIALECGWCVGQFHKNHLILKIAIISFEGYFPFIAFSDPYLMINIGQVELSEMSSSA